MSNSNASFKDDDISKAVAKLLKNKSQSSHQILEELKQQYKDEDIVDSIMNRYKEKLKRVKKIADKIRERLLSKYPHLSQKEYLDKIYGYKKKYGFDDSEMQAIVNLVLLKKERDFLTKDQTEPNVTEMSKALGFVPVSWQTSGRLRATKEEQEHVEAIKSNALIYSGIHQQVAIQSLITDDCSLASTFATLKFEKQKVNIYSYVHPIVFALFMPKFAVLEEHMLLASIAEIINKKAEGIELNTMPEYELYWNIATDPAEVACVNKVRPFADLLSRCNIQSKLWESVLDLRQGKLYTNDLTSFLIAIDSCRASVFDAADLAYVKDEGTLLRKLFAAFSFRPTLVLTNPSMDINTNPNISNLATAHITRLSMVTLRLPMNYAGGIEDDYLDLNNALANQMQIYIHHGRITIKEQTILQSRELIVFYVHRRYQKFSLTRLQTPWTYTTLPVTMSQFEKFQSTGIILNNEMSIPRSESTLTLLLDLLSEYVLRV